MDRDYDPLEFRRYQTKVNLGDIRNPLREDLDKLSFEKNLLRGGSREGRKTPRFRTREVMCVDLTAVRQFFVLFCFFLSLLWNP